MGKYFTTQELTYSTTAKKYGINNTPTPEVKEHIEELIEVLDGIREKWGSAIIVSSGYRCPELNAKLGGVKTSGHLTGYAVDMVPANNHKTKFFEFMKEYLKDKNIEFDELLLERNTKSTWIHFALYGMQGKQRKKIKTLEA